jgi:hypothetical protein
MVLKNASAKKPEPLGKSEAKKHLSVLLHNDTNNDIAGMAVEDVHKLSTLFQPYNIKRYTGYLTTLKNGIAKKKKAPTKKPPTWGESEAKKHLYALLHNDTNGIAGMAVEDVHKLSTLFQPYDVKRFTGYLKALKRSIANANLPEPPPWKTSKAKKTLRILLENDADGEIHSMDAAAVQMLSSLFEDYSETNFKTNLRRTPDGSAYL